MIPVTSARLCDLADDRAGAAEPSADVLRWVIDTSGVTGRLMTSGRPIMMSNEIVHYAGCFDLPISPTRLFLASTAVGFANEFCTMPTAKIVREIDNLVAGQGRILTICCQTTL
ncbi:hypothetical protein FHT86_006288 [Rhizobium sp. BK313]|nr:hypothetical protein [Rhizobium sp. BK313]